MNPPFPKKKTDYKEYLFIEQALKQMQNNAILFSVLPYSSLIKGGVYLNWRQRLLKENTLLSVITFPPDLFAPIGVRTVGIFIKKGIPQKDRKVLWIRALHDGFRLKKAKRFRYPNEEDDLEKIKPLLKEWCENQKIEVTNKPEFQKATQIDFDDEGLELCPEAYLDERSASDQEIEDSVEQMIRENIAFLMKYEPKLKGSQ
jgi:type I restriction-modification system DNA methylase subunit